MEKDIGTLIVDSQSKPIKINAIKIEGIVHTKHEFLEEITKPLLEAKTLGDVIIGSRNIGNQLQKLGIFKDISITFDADPTTAKDFVDVVYKVEEAPRLFAKTGADFGNNDSSMVMKTKTEYCHDRS
jgi:outer membrane protein insertion porin family